MEYMCWLVFDDKDRMVGVYRTKQEAKKMMFETDVLKKGFATEFK